MFTPFTYEHCSFPYYSINIALYLQEEDKTGGSLVTVSLQWINSSTLVLVDSHEKLQVVDRSSQEVLETLDLEQVQLVYNSRHFKSLATGGNVSQALVREEVVGSMTTS